MTVKDLVGEFAIIGNNQDENGSEYSGTLTLSLDENFKIVAVWNINNDQKQFGAGFFKDRILVINFHYFDDSDKIYRGTVVYKFFDTNTFDGFWSEEQANQKYLGLERGIRIGSKGLNS